MDGAVIFFFVLAALIVGFVVWALVSVTRSTGGESSGDTTGNFQQKLIDINKVPHPEGKGTVWVPSDN